MTEKNAWVKNFIGSITVCDVNGVILEMNEVSAEGYAKDGGMALIGQNMFGCHSPASCEKLTEMLAKQQQNVYTIQKNGQKKLIFQQPWYQDGEFAGFVEISLPIPEQMPHFNRD